MTTLFTPSFIYEKIHDSFSKREKLLTREQLGEYQTYTVRESLLMKQSVSGVLL